jgi:hypothetical protein
VRGYRWFKTGAFSLFRRLVGARGVLQACPPPGHLESVLLFAYNHMTMRGK